MKTEKLNISQTEGSSFSSLPSQLYAQEFLDMVPNKLNKTFFHSAFLIEDKGRVVLYNNPDLKIDGRKAMALGYFECVDNQETASALLSAAANEAFSAGAEWLIGPMNGSTWENYRYSTSHDEPNFFLEPYHHLYYNRIWQNFGFTTLANYSSSMDRLMNLYEPDQIYSLQTRMQDAGVIIRPVNRVNYEEEIRKLHAFCSELFAKNYLFTPIPENDFVQKYLPLRNFMDTDCVLLAEDKNQNLLAVFFAIPDLYNKKTPTLIVKTIACTPQRQYAGLMRLMCNRAVQTAREKGFKQMIHAFMHQTNQSNSVSGKFSGEVFREYKLYGKQINEMV